MRIIAGTYRGKKLFTPLGDDIRPTADRSRESIFNILNSKIGGEWEEYSLLDIFSGTGAFALEAISRGISSVCMIDKDISLSSKNAMLFSNEKTKIGVLRADALNLPMAAKKYDIAFMDAPYGKNMSGKCLEQLKAKGWIDVDSICIVELSKKEAFIVPEGFEIIDERVYGIAKFIFLQLNHVS